MHKHGEATSHLPTLLPAAAPTLYGRRDTDRPDGAAQPRSSEAVVVIRRARRTHKTVEREPHNSYKHYLAALQALLPDITHGAIER